MTQQEINDLLNSDWAVRRNTAGNPNTPVEVLTKLSDDSHWAVRRNTAGNPNTPVEVLTKLSDDSDWAVRRNTAGDKQFIVTKTYVAIQGTTYMWYKHNAEKPFYTCGCFHGNREQLVSRIRSVDQSKDPAVRLRILEQLDQKFAEVFNK